jgi:nucleoid DNA-binding protein
MKQIIAEISKNSHLSQTEVKLVLNAFVASWKERIECKVPLMIQGLGKMVYREKPAKRQYMPFNGTYRDMPSSTNNQFLLAKPIRKIYNEDK